MKLFLAILLRSLRRLDAWAERTWNWRDENPLLPSDMDEDWWRKQW